MVNPEDTLPFTARLMAHYRAEEAKKDNPLILDPYAERLRGNLSNYLSSHRHTTSSGDYSIVRSFFVEEQLLQPWVGRQKRSQIILLGAGLDTRAYRCSFLQGNDVTFYELDFPSLLEYKTSRLAEVQPLCCLTRIPCDLSNKDWSKTLISEGFLSDVATYWVLEGLLYYLEEHQVQELLKRIAKLTEHPESKLFADVCVPTLSNLSFGPFMSKFRWGVSPTEIVPFFQSNGWSTTWSYADEHDQGRDVGQRGMMFVVGAIGEEEKAHYETNTQDVTISPKKIALDVFSVGKEKIPAILKSIGSNHNNSAVVFHLFITAIQPRVKILAESLRDNISVGKISPRLLREPPKPNVLQQKAPEEQTLIIVGYLEAILLLSYCVWQGCEGWELVETPLYKTYLQQRQLSNPATISTLMQLFLPSENLRKREGTSQY